MRDDIIDLMVMQPKVQIMPVCEALSGKTYIYLCCFENILSNVAGDRTSFFSYGFFESGEDDV